MLDVSTRSLKIIAALVWHAGGLALLFKGGSLLVEAEGLKPGESWSWLAAVAGSFLGGLKANYLFSKSCRRNLDRITALEQPKVWQFFRPGFLVLLGVMILVGAMLSKLAHNNYPFLVGVGIADVSIAIALLGSSYVFWKEKAFCSTSVA